MTLKISSNMHSSVELIGMICSQSVFLLLSTRLSMAGLTPPTLTRNSLARYLKLLQLIPPFPVPNNKNLATFHTLLIGSFMVNDRYSNFIIPNISHCSLLGKIYKILSTCCYDISLKIETPVYNKFISLIYILTLTFCASGGCSQFLFWGTCFA